MNKSSSECFSPDQEQDPVPDFTITMPTIILFSVWSVTMFTDLKSLCFFYYSLVFHACIMCIGSWLYQ